MQKLTLSFLSAWVILFSCAEKPVPDLKQIRWMTLNEAVAQLQHTRKPVPIDLYTDWCAGAR
jgi:thiol:disulfide interchange protein